MSAGAVPIDEEELAAQQAAADMPDEPAAPESADLPAPVDSEPAPAPAPGAPDLMPPDAAVLDAPAAVPAAVAPDPVALVGKGGASIKRPIITPQETAAVESLPGITRSKVAAARQGETVDIAKSGVEQTRLDKQAEIERKYLEDQARIRAEQEKIIAERKAKLDAQIEANDGRKMHDYFSTERGGNRVLAAIMGALGGFNQRYNGGVNIGTQAVKQKIEEDYRLQKDEIDREFRKEVRLRGDVATAEKERDQALHNLDVNKVGMYRAAGAEAAAQLQRQGVPAIQAKTNALVANMEEEGQKTYIGLLQKQHGEITNTYKGRPGGGGGGVKGPISELVQMKIEGYDAAEIQRRAEQLNIKPKDYRPLIQDVRVDEAAAAKRLGKAGKTGDETIVRDKQGAPMGRIPTGRGGVVKFANEDANYTAAIGKLERLKKHVEENGERVFGPQATKDRQTLYDDAGIAVGIVSPLGKTDTALEHEFGTLGKSGAYTAQGANLDAINRKIEEVKTNQQMYRNQTLTPITPEELADINARGKGGHEAPAGEAKPPAPKPAEGAPEKSGELTNAQRARLVTIRDDPSKPPTVRARARALLKAK